MARSLSQTLIRSPISFLFSSTYRDGVRLVSSRQYSTHSKSSYQVVDSSSSAELEALAVRSIEDAIHGIVVKRSTPDWLPFVPGASFWVPPKRTDFGVAEMVHKIAYTSALSDDEVMSLTTFFGWPSSEFFIQGRCAFLLNIVVACDDTSSDTEIRLKTSYHEAAGVAHLAVHLSPRMMKAK